MHCLLLYRLPLRHDCFASAAISLTHCRQQREIIPVVYKGSVTYLTPAALSFALTASWTTPLPSPRQVVVTTGLPLSCEARGYETVSCEPLSCVTRAVDVSSGRFGSCPCEAEGTDCSRHELWSCEPCAYGGAHSAPIRTGFWPRWCCQLCHA
jgi:hypothetical protein